MLQASCLKVVLYLQTQDSGDSNDKVRRPRFRTYPSIAIHHPSSRGEG